MSGGNAPAPVLSPREAALRAVELRARAPPPRTPSASTAHADLLSTSTPTASTTPFAPSAVDKLKFHRIIDTQLYPKTSSVQRVATLDTLLKLTGNILTPPEGSTTSSAAFKRIRMSNSLVKRHLVDAGGGAGYDYLVECGFRSVKEEFEHFLILCVLSSCSLEGIPHLFVLQSIFPFAETTAQPPSRQLRHQSSTRRGCCDRRAGESIQDVRSGYERREGWQGDAGIRGGPSIEAGA